MGVVYVARSAGLSRWAASVGLGKHIYKVGFAESKEALKAAVEAGWAGETDWKVLKAEDAAVATENDVVARVARKERTIDPAYYPKLKGATGIVRLSEQTVVNHVLVTRALSGTEERAELKLKPADFATYLLQAILG